MRECRFEFSPATPAATATYVTDGAHLLCGRSMDVTHIHHGATTAMFPVVQQNQAYAGDTRLCG
jgi:hypothetical protein